jgi:septal ring factor EnvC (AmiA/AmiB activator)
LAISRNALKQKDAIAASLRNERDALRNEQDALRNERDALRKERDALRHQRDELRRNLDAAYRQTTESAERIAKLNSHIEELKITRFEAKRECHSLKTSLSWRVTWPLRVVRDRSAAVLNRLRSRRNLLLASKALSSPPTEESKTDPNSAAPTQDSHLETKHGRLQRDLPTSNGNGVCRSSALRARPAGHLYFRRTKDARPHLRVGNPQSLRSGAEVRIIE